MPKKLSLEQARKLSESTRSLDFVDAEIYAIAATGSRTARIWFARNYPEEMVRALRSLRRRGFSVDVYDLPSLLNPAIDVEW